MELSLLLAKYVSISTSSNRDFVIDVEESMSMSNIQWQESVVSSLSQHSLLNYSMTYQP